MNNSGIFIVDKPQGITTNKLIQQVKRKLNLKKVGHAGTLDPLATGVVIVLVNSGTKLSDYFLNQEKIYQVKGQLYTATDSFDSDGNITETDETSHVTLKQLEQVIDKYNDYEYEQIPPIFSAIKVQGKKLYEYARCGVSDVAIQPRKVHIKKVELLSFDEEMGIFELRVEASKGTYIRSLVVDIAHDLNTLAHVTELRRLKSGVFDINQAKTLDDLELKDLISNYDAVKQNEYQIYELNKEEFDDVIKGKKIKLDLEKERVFLSYNNEIIALYGKENDYYRSLKGGFSV
ncbi:tRNA pseudouridine(55) synthase TruB [Mesoplasma lactucae]|uniref:tRNA pseudouridine synthase B n=1 Tax=Mesoplasma lactucae ATCC 49193 TaxID=81460 RepID=A0A291IRF8_9MOLU|nr:tRNA pseudouridine(55) synthase TruB [Mesoplasma lactucae]ATG97452.1 tRNA pseudouridine(55) synthase TruB [Mesoplasma lactucae ATCC 49193]ATZ20093.1 tRNA pseudouridine synthase B [Mesoplasma lactucae ATCC 49193]MCL8216841.1 tRNA pseudouridine synthase B [Mesoplasma lactucae ATCC 49193]